MQSVNGLFVYLYHHDDDRHGWTPLERFKRPVYFDPGHEDQSGRPTLTGLTPEFIASVHMTLMECGWEGDGTLEAMMVPPFFTNQGDSFWFPVFHVKQRNNGTSWIASERPLSVEDIEPRYMKV